MHRECDFILIFLYTSTIKVIGTYAFLSHVSFQKEPMMPPKHIRILRVTCIQVAFIVSYVCLKFLVFLFFFIFFYITIFLSAVATNFIFQDDNIHSVLSKSILVGVPEGPIVCWRYLCCKALLDNLICFWNNGFDFYTDKLPLGLGLLELEK